jgi:exodeoxyribonuclease-3
MTEMKVTSWNVNSIRTRLDHVLNWIDEHQPDVLCLQETKVRNEQFPLDAFKERGLNVYFHGQPAYNGVALITPHTMEDVENGFPEGDLFDQCRVISGTLNGVRIVNVYAPQGDNPESPKFEMKEVFYKRLKTYLEEKHTPSEDVLICGDFNIAPEARDVDDAEKRAGKCMFHPLEHEWYGALLNWGLQDSFRLFSEEEGLFSWWDYRMNSFKRNLGVRIDHVLVTDSLAKKAISAEIDKEPRALEKPSDHVPVSTTFKL